MDQARVRRVARVARVAPALAVGALAAATAVALQLRDPHVDGSWGWCPTALLGLSCPFCGSLRAVNDLGHLRLGAAASSNLLLVLALPVVVVLWLRRVRACWRGGGAAVPLVVPRPAWVGFVVVLAVFTLVRNLPFGGWLAP